MNRSALVLTAALVFVSSPLIAQRATKPPVAATVVSTEVVNLNSATAAQIASLPGIGPKTADLVVQYRAEERPIQEDRRDHERARRRRKELPENQGSAHGGGGEK